jgi:two-component system cell cycle response regulator
MLEPLVFAVIDDDVSMRRLLTAMIHGSGDVVVEAPTRADGEVVIREYPWDIAVIAGKLADGDGIELCRQANANDGTSHRHVVLLGSDADDGAKVRGFDAGADDYVLRSVDPVELRARLRAMRRNVAVQKALLARLATLEQLSVIDGLTQVYNHRFFESELRRLFDVAARHARPLALAMIDIDHFKRINDTFGHRAGDLVLTEVSTTIAQNVRGSDVLARYGGEEFAVVLPEARLADAALLGERLREAVANATVRDAFGSVRVTISVGIAAIPAPGIDSPARLIEAADSAMYAAKSAGRNRVASYMPRPGDGGAFKTLEL